MSYQCVSMGTDFPMKSLTVLNPFSSIQLLRPSHMSSTILKPCFMAAVQTCTVVDPNSINSAASFQVLMPPIPETGTFDVTGSCAIVASIFNAMGFTADPQ